MVPREGGVANPRGPARGALIPHLTHGQFETVYAYLCVHMAWLSARQGAFIPT